MSELTVIVCPSCLQKYRVQATFIGKRAKCKTCGERFKVAEPTIDDDTICGWMTGEDPSGGSVMGSTTIFAAAVATDDANATKWQHPPPPDIPRVRFARIDDTGAYFEFESQQLYDHALRCSFPHRCVHCLSPQELDIHYLIWGDKLPRSDALRLGEAEVRARRNLSDVQKKDPLGWFDHLEPIAMLPPPFRNPFPYFVCDHCSAIGAVNCEIHDQGGDEWCTLAIANLTIAADFYRNNGGRGHNGYQDLLVASRRQKDNQWKLLPFAVRTKLSQWFTLAEGEKFLGYFADEDFSRAEAGVAGLILTDKRIVYKKYASQREYSLPAGGTVHVEANKSAAMIELSQDGQRDAMLSLRPLRASSFARSLEALNVPWQIEVTTRRK
jgi:hypothetical protein